MKEDDIIDIDIESSVDVSSKIDSDDADVIVIGENQHKFTKLTEVGNGRHKLSGMYKDWFLDYASYVILERAVPHLYDGLKPVQRRILHSMKQLDDGRYNKVANIIGSTMQYHPHGDRSIGDALVQLGQKDMLIDCQGNWGNIYTGDSAAAPRYIEARLSKFALDVVFNAKTTTWMMSYDGRNQEPVALPVKFPLLLVQGVEGIAVGLASKILPHNFNEVIDASIAYLKDQEFELYPDFPTGGMIDISKYNDGLRGGTVKVRAKIIKIDKNTLSITELPFGKTTTSLIESIIKANDKNKIKIKRVDDNTAENVEVLVHLANDVSSDKTIDALYAFTDCEISISPNSCVIAENKPLFLGITEILKINTDHTKELLKAELDIRMSELKENWHMSSLEKIFIENRIYRSIEECETWEEILEAIDKGITPYKQMFYRDITKDDIVKLTEIKIKRISKYDAFKADEYIRSIEEEIEKIKKNLDELVQYTISYFKRIKDKYGKNKERKTELRNFSSIEAAQVAVTNSKLYVNREEGFYGIGNSMKKEEYVCDCSDIDDVIVFTKDGRYIITKVSEKAYYNKDILYIGVFKRNDERTIYNVMYRDGLKGAIYSKRCAIKGITRDREYDITKGTDKSEILYMSVNPNGEAEVLKVYFKPRPRLKKLVVEFDFADQIIKGRGSQGNMFTRYVIHKIIMKSKGISTLNGQNIWLDSDINKLNSDGRGNLIGEFIGEDKIIVFTKSGSYYTNGYEVGQYFPEDLLMIEKYNPDKIYSVTYWDAEQKYFYIKRFCAEITDKPQLFIDENKNSYMLEITSDKYPRLEIVFGGENSMRIPEEINVDEFIGVKSHRAKGKRVSNYCVSTLTFTEPFIVEDSDDEDDMINEEAFEDEDSYEPDVEEEDENDDSVEQHSLFDDLK